MRNDAIAWFLGGLLALAGPIGAQDVPAGGKKAEDETTVKKEDVKTWILHLDGKDYEAHPATPAYEGETGLFHMSTAYSLPKGKFSFSLFRDNLDRDPKDIDFSVFGLSLAYGATSRLEIFGNVGIQNRLDADALFEGGFVSDYPFAGNPTVSPEWQTGFGDVKLGAKYAFLDDYDRDPVGLALRGFVKFGTADATLGLGTGKTSFGGDLILSKNINYAADVHASVGYVINSNPNGQFLLPVDPLSPSAAIPGGSTTINVGNYFKWGVGLNFPAMRRLQLQAEATGAVFNKSADWPQTNWVDIVVGPVLYLDSGVFLRAAFSVNANYSDTRLNQGIASYSDYQVSVGYHPGTRARAVYNPPPPPPPNPNRPPTVQCEVEKSTILPGETVRVRATASDPDNDPLTYEWSASTGKVTGTGPEATFDSAGVTAPATVSVTVRVSDGRGGTAESRCTINVQAPQPKLEAITCTSGGFPNNLARLNNVDKACLDDVASRLKQDPRSRVIIVGHADSHERYPEVIGRKRAEAVKTYLVKERGIDESRITAKSAGASKPLDTGTTALARAKNRRVDVIFVPEGAAAPEDDD
jgi:outer membrane protein OmpA-like peptidoglycan-associated protein